MRARSSARREQDAHLVRRGPQIEKLLHRPRQLRASTWEQQQVLLKQQAPLRQPGVRPVSRLQTRLQLPCQCQSPADTAASTGRQQNESDHDLTARSASCRALGQAINQMNKQVRSMFTINPDPKKAQKSTKAQRVHHEGFHNGVVPHAAKMRGQHALHLACATWEQGATARRSVRLPDREAGSPCTLMAWSVGAPLLPMRSSA